MAVGCGGTVGEAAAPADPPVIEVPAEPPTEPPSPTECVVEVEFLRTATEAEARAPSADAAHTAACARACEALVTQGADCNDEARYEQVATEKRAQYSSAGGAAEYTYRCVVVERQVEAQRANAPAGQRVACAQAHRALCANDGCRGGRVRSVGGVDVQDLSTRVSTVVRQPPPATPTTGSSRCALGLTIRSRQGRGVATDDTGGTADMDQLVAKARAAACAKLGLADQCADSDQVSIMHTSRRLTVTNGQSSASVEVVLATLHQVEAEGRGSDRAAACAAAAIEACRSQACDGQSSVTVRAIDGVPVLPPRPKSRPGTGLFGLPR